jgi:autotransporter-associated beta strand protein
LHGLIFCVISAVLTDCINAANIYWDGTTSTSWADITNWSTSNTNAIPDPLAVPGVADLAVFNSSTVNTPQTINLDLNRAVAGLQFVSPLQTTIQSGAGTNQLSIAANGIIVGNTSGVVVINPQLQLTANQEWNNSSNSPLYVSGNVEGGPNFLHISGAGNTILSGVLQSAGALIKSGSGALTLTQTNSFAGSVIVNGGQVRINNDANLGNGGLILNNGTLQLDAAVSITRNIFLNIGGGVIETSNSDSVILGSIVGPGGLVKQGMGNLTLTGSNSFTDVLTVAQGSLKIFNGSLGSGPVLVKAGATLELVSTFDFFVANSFFVQPGGVLRGNGTFRTLEENLTTVMGVIDPGNSVGHLTFESNVELTESAEVIMEIESTSSFDTIAITGDANLGGTLTVSVPNDGSIQAGDSFEIITAGDILGTEFDDVVTEGADGYFLAPVYSGLSVALFTYNDGDMNRSGDGTADQDDVPAFALALTNPRNYRSQFGISAKEAGDIDGDGDCDVDDIDDFADLLGMSVATLNYRIQLALAVPEPSTGLLLLLTGLAFSNHTRRLRCRS